MSGLLGVGCLRGDDEEGISRGGVEGQSLGFGYRSMMVGGTEADAYFRRTVEV